MAFMEEQSLRKQLFLWDVGSSAGALPIPIAPHNAAAISIVPANNLDISRILKAGNSSPEVF
jgi:precorrin-6B methylase 2